MIMLVRHTRRYPHLFPLGPASGQFPRRGASRSLLFRPLPRNLVKPRRRFARAPPEKPSLALGVVSTRLWVPQVKGAKKEKQNVSEFDPNHRLPRERPGDRKSTRLNSSHVRISYAVFCLQKKNTLITKLGHYPHT